MFNPTKSIIGAAEKWDGDKNVTIKVVGSDANVIVGGK